MPNPPTKHDFEQLAYHREHGTPMTLTMFARLNDAGVVVRR